MRVKSAYLIVEKESQHCTISAEAPSTATVTVTLDSKRKHVRETTHDTVLYEKYRNAFSVSGTINCVMIE